MTGIKWGLVLYLQGGQIMWTETLYQSLGEATEAALSILSRQFYGPIEPGVIVRPEDISAVKVREVTDE